MSDGVTLFGLISSKDVVASSGKVLSPEAYTAGKTAVDILEHAKVDAEEYKKQKEKEIEEAKNHAYQKGYEEGTDKLSKVIADLLKTIEIAQKEATPQIAKLAVLVARKVVGEALKEPETIVSIVRKALGSVYQHHKIILYVSKQDLETIEKNKENLKSIFESLQEFSVQVGPDLQPGDCEISTEVGKVSAKLENTWKIISSHLERINEI